MDNSNEEDVSSTPSTPRPTPASTTATTDDESSLTTSTDSELLSTWTLVTDKTKQKHRQEEDDSKEHKQQLADELKQAMHEAAIERVEELHTPNDEEPDYIDDEVDTKETKADSAVDDLSDGISIISESDSGGRLSPHPFLSELKFSESFPLNNDRIAKGPIVLEGASELKQRKRKRSSSRTRSTDVATDEQLHNALLQSSGSALAVDRGEHLQCLVRRGLSAVFYVGVAVALLALYGKIRNPEWEPLSAAKQPMAELQQRVTDMELQNNLMRAEIDILSRQVNYLSNAKQPPSPPPQQQSVPAKGDHVKSKHFKAWSGNGERLEPIDISKGDLKRPYKCPNGQFVEIAGMCVEHSKDSLVETVGDVLETLREGSNLLKDVGEEPTKPVNAQNQEPLPSQKYQKDFKPPNPQEQNKQQRPYPNNNSKERFSNNKENRYSKPGGDSKEHSRKRFKADDSRESGERFQRDKPSSKEQWRKSPPYPKGSAERVHKGSGEWHEKLMQQRETSRRHHEQKRNDKNWYIERGAGREHMRYS